MTESQRKAVYAAAAAVLAALGAWGIVDAATQDQILQVVQGGLTALMAIIPLIAHRKVGASGVDAGVLTAADPGMNPPADVVDASDPGMNPPADDDPIDLDEAPRHAETDEAADEVTPTADGGADPEPAAVVADAADEQGHTA